MRNPYVNPINHVTLLKFQARHSIFPPVNRHGILIIHLGHSNYFYQRYANRVVWRTLINFGAIALPNSNAVYLCLGTYLNLVPLSATTLDIVDYVFSLSCRVDWVRLKQFSFYWTYMASLETCQIKGASILFECPVVHNWYKIKFKKSKFFQSSPVRAKYNNLTCLIK